MKELAEMQSEKTKLVLNNSGEVIISVEGSKVSSIKVEQGKVMDQVLDILIDLKFDVDAGILSTFCSEVEQLFEFGRITHQPSLEVKDGVLIYENGQIVFRRDNDAYFGKKVSEVIVKNNDTMNHTFIRMCLIREGIQVDDVQYKKFKEDIIKFSKQEEIDRIDINESNYKEYLGKVPNKVLITFLKEYFNRR